MFKSKSRPIVIPQAEHLRQVGALAQMWGNAEFDLPPIPRESMIAGMALHDRGYGLMDKDAIGEMAEQTWHGIARRGFSMYCSDVIADTIAKYHVRRLARNPDRPERVALAAEFSQGIDEHLARHGLSKGLFERIDRITNLLDQLSFNFCFEAPAVGRGQNRGAKRRRGRGLRRVSCRRGRDSSESVAVCGGRVSGLHLWLSSGGLPRETRRARLAVFS